VKGGLELHKLSRPRRAGDFGHDLQAFVNNPNVLPLQPFRLGIELYTGAIGYHLSTIPQYVNQFDLKGMIIISKDNPWERSARLALLYSRASSALRLLLRLLLCAPVITSIAQVHRK
jgi:hypothetical protein